MVSADLIVTLIPLLPLLGFLIITLGSKKIGHGAASTIACSAVLMSFFLAAWIFIFLLNAGTDVHVIKTNLFTWIAAGDFSVDMSFLVDPLSITMLLIITGVGFLIHVYSIGYMHDDPGFNKFFSYLNLFVFFMLMLVMGSNYLVMFVGWEGVGLCSYLLIGFWFKNQDYNDAANKAFIMNRIGDLGLLLGLILIFINYGSLNYTDVFTNAQSVDGATITAITMLLFVGAMGKSAQIPLYTWLPDAMAGPTPVSALIHAATMVTAGVYMVARNNILYTLSPASLQLVLIVGLATSLFAATIALTQNDIKKVLAYSTVSQLGLMFVALGVGAYASGIFHMMTHAFFKALLFLGAGSVIHALHHEQDIRRMGGLKKYLPITYGTFLIGVLAISGIPPFAGFFSKDEILANAFAQNPIAWSVALAASLLTSFYMFRLFFLTFHGQPRMGDDKLHHIHESPRSITVPLMILAGLSIVGGFFNVPEALFGSSRLEQFLAPVFAKSAELAERPELSHSTEYALMGAVIVLTLVIIGIAYSMYVSKNSVPVAEGQEKGFQKVLYHKYYIDELYNAIIVKPLYWNAAILDRIVEKMGIDRFVNAAGESVIDWSKVFRFLQNGSIGFYIFAMVIGIVLMLAASIINFN
ncbi:MAG TPA: NADH-quinone oxidoreductase subunit L [Cyclobacteriaceae bacterium]|nr:NADH-quinone oxidoreductase subunit L [Cyclobacteriaceae bacterium]